MKKIDICLTPNLLPLYALENRAVVIVDILRATSSITAGIASGIKSILTVAKVEQCQPWQQKGYIGAGERDGKKVDGFALGNSPFSYMAEELKGKSIVMTTTNGTLAIHKSRKAREIIIGSFLNISAVAEHLRAQPYDVLIVCAGWKGKFNLEDTLFAGALAEKLKGDFEYECDSVIAATALWNASKDDLMEAMKNSSHYRRLRHLDVEDDIEFCLTADKFDVVPVVGKRKEILAPMKQ